MDRNLRWWELALMGVVLFTLLAGLWIDREQADLAGRVIRLHVIANSDSLADQELKLAVRDRVLEQAEKLYPSNANREQARAALESALPQLAAAGRAEVEARGFDYPVSASLAQNWFPTKEYGEFALPAGEYAALQVVIGAGAGRNWWCVAFPPLCLGAASQTVDSAVAAGEFTPEQGALMTRDGEQYVLKFKAMELWNQLTR